MGILKFLGFGTKKGGNRLVVATYEGPNRLRLNGNRTTDARGKRGAIAHDRTVCWIEFTRDGARLDQGLGQAAGKLPASAAESLLRNLPMDPACRGLLQDLEGGRDFASRNIGPEKWGHGRRDARGTGGP